MMGTQMETTKPSGNELLSYLRDCLGDISDRLAVKFDLFDRSGRPRRAFITDSLLRFSCLGCLWKVFTQVRRRDNFVDALYREMHVFAVNILTGALMHVLYDGFDVCCEEAGEYGRVDVAVKPASFGVTVEVNDAFVAVEVKTGHGLSSAQLFRYLLHHPNAVLVVWRVAMNQVFTLKGKELQTLLCMYMSSAVIRALKLLNCGVAECSHNLDLNKSTVIGDPQRLLDDFFKGLTASLPKVVATVKEILKGVNFHAD